MIDQKRKSLVLLAAFVALFFLIVKGEPPEFVLGQFSSPDQMATLLQIYQLARIALLSLLLLSLFRHRKIIFGLLQFWRQAHKEAWSPHPGSVAGDDYSKTTTFALAAGAVVLGAWFYFSTTGFFFDDAFITARYAQNLASGFGPVWNPGETSAEGYTSLLYMVLLTLFELGGVPAEISLRFLGAASLLALILTVLLAGRLLKLPCWARILAAGLVLANPFICFHSNNGLETILFCTLALLFVCLWALSREELKVGKYTLSMTASAILLATARPEGLLPVVVLLGMQAIEGIRKKKMSWGATPLAVVGGFWVALTIWRVLYYGDPLPNTFYAKQGSLQINWDHVAIIGEFLAVHSILILLAGIGCFAAWRFERRTLFGLLTVLAIMAYYPFPSTVMNVYFRHFMFTIPILSLLAGLGLVQLARLLSLIVPNTARTVIVAFLCCLIALVAAREGKWPVRYAEGYGDMIFNSHGALGKIAGKYLDPSMLIALGDAGAISYYSGLRIVDYLALTDKTVRTLAGDNEAIADHILRLKPDIFVLVFSDNCSNDETFGRLTKRITHHDLFKGYRSAAKNEAHLQYCQNVFVREDLTAPKAFWAALHAWSNVETKLE
jgi:hypothetical protein